MPHSVVDADGVALNESETTTPFEVAVIVHVPPDSTICGTKALTEMAPAAASHPADEMKGTTGVAGGTTVGVGVGVGVAVAVGVTVGVGAGVDERVGLGDDDGATLALGDTDGLLVTGTSAGCRVPFTKKIAPAMAPSTTTPTTTQIHHVDRRSFT